jgi:hypothetical protein
VANAQPFALYDVLTRSSDIEQQIDEMVLQQVHFVDIKKPAMGAGEEARLEFFCALGQRAL